VQRWAGREIWGESFITGTQAKHWAPGGLASSQPVKKGGGENDELSPPVRKHLGVAGRGVEPLIKNNKSSGKKAGKDQPGKGDKRGVLGGRRRRRRGLRSPYSSVKINYERPRLVREKGLKKET